MKNENLVKPTKKGTDKENNGNRFTDIYDVLKNIGLIHSRIKREITSDFIYAKLGDKDKEFVIEMSVNAFDVFKTYVLFEYNVREKYGDEYFEDIKEHFHSYRNHSFDTFMNRVFMIVNMNRNQNDNFMINIMSQLNKMKEESLGELNQDKVKERLKEMAKENGN
jgi:hypothetical protein